MYVRIIMGKSYLMCVCNSSVHAAAAHSTKWDWHAWLTIHKQLWKLLYKTPESHYTYVCGNIRGIMRTEWQIRTCTIQVCQPLYMYKTQYVYVTQHSWAIKYRACIDTHSHWHAAFLTWSRLWRTVGLSRWVTAHVQQRPLMAYMYVYYCMTTDQLILLYYYMYIILCILQLVKNCSKHISLYGSQMGGWKSKRRKQQPSEGGHQQRDSD